jgi:hypothetical protein
VVAVRALSRSARAGRVLRVAFIAYQLRDLAADVDDGMLYRESVLSDELLHEQAQVRVYRVDF